MCAFFCFTTLYHGNAPHLLLSCNGCILFHKHSPPLEKARCWTSLTSCTYVVHTCIQTGPLSKGEQKQLPAAELLSTAQNILAQLVQQSVMQTYGSLGSLERLGLSCSPWYGRLVRPGSTTADCRHFHASLHWWRKDVAKVARAKCALSIMATTSAVSFR